MQTQKILKIFGKTFVIADFREKEIIEKLRKLGAVVIEKNLEVGDFLCSERVGIERKRHADFIGSIIDGRIFEQARNLRRYFEKPIVIIEGFSNRKISENALRSAVASLLIDFEIPLLTTANSSETAKSIFWIAKREQMEKGRDVGIKVGKKPKETKKLQEFIVSSIPGVSTIIARRLLRNFGSVEKIFKAKEEELMRVKGVGRKLAKQIRKILTAKYEV